ncbi:hypothetical protein G6F46_013076 [Rhizopus delemar]|uniref:Tc1-like transposase DDE domain-containing protein n=2 Tax=Rhizopus TaxID=4842 RepID=A0A9P6YE93_9FUNG|nr:hypothetical protein G6F55_012977 [Rhizopus delemar]KAG1532052.1 hypothetical protein G6F51_013286 [Rhizopus arrhizus]KAG1498536.1 hypothetical protein G6F52_012748 [Rhizopus delemar]KAG1536039.1 hypothetical protein G6F49_013054 [Rhizopus delemar]KAG1546253.1 hypothetical protein G6F50_013656 [Rhizopus delemar]
MHRSFLTFIISVCATSIEKQSVPRTCTPPQLSNEVQQGILYAIILGVTVDLTVKGGQGSVMVWGCITYDGFGYACWIHDGTMKAVDYVNILETTLMDSLKYYGYNHEDVYFQQDKDPKHTSKLAKQWFVDNNFNSDHIYSWPAQSPDLNPIEHVWHHLKLKLSVYDTKAKGVHELWEKIEKERNTFTVDECRRYIDSMPDRCKAVIKAKGGHTRY